MNRRRITSGAATALGIVVLAGCGGGSSSASHASATAGSSATGQSSQSAQSADHFKTAIAPVISRFKNAAIATGVALQHASSDNDQQVVETFRHLRARWQSALSTLETLQPPPQSEAAYTRLSHDVSEVTADLGAIVSAAQGHDVSAIKVPTVKLIRNILSAKAASKTFTG